MEPDHWEFRDFVGNHKEGTFYSQGQGRSDSKGKFTVNITGKNVLLDEELHAALQQEGLKNAWVNLAPKGRMNFEARVVKMHETEPPDVEVTVAPLGCSFRPAFFPYTLNEVRGTIHYHQGQVELTRLTAQHGPTALGLELGRVFLKPTGGLVVNLFGVSGDPLVPDDEFVTAIPQRMRET